MPQNAFARDGKGTEGKERKGKEREKGGEWNLGGFASLTLGVIDASVGYT